jgi:hypothetical protein
MSLARPVSVRTGAETGGIDFQLRLVPLFEVTGRVHALPGERPQLGLWSVPSNDFLSAYYREGGGVPSGGFRAGDLPPGRYRITAMLRGTEATAQPRSPLRWAALDFTVIDRDLNDLDLTLQPSMTASGRLVADAPAAGQRARVLFQVIGRPPIDAAPRPGLIGLNGEFEVADLLPGSYTIVVYTNNNDLTPITATLNGQPLENNRIEVSASTNITGLEIRLSLHHLIQLRNQFHPSRFFRAK